MRLKLFSKILLSATIIAFVSCRTQSTAEKKDIGHSNTSSTTASLDNAAKAQVVEKVVSNAQSAQYITSKIKLHLQVGDKDVSLGGKLCMKRDDVIRIQLTAFGLMEIGRMEFTNDYVMVMDRMNKQYVKLDYNKVDFLAQSGLNFNSLQSLFWNELFLPNNKCVTTEEWQNYDIALEDGNNVSLSTSKGNLNYKWKANANNGQISSFDGFYKDKEDYDVSVNWDYGSFEPLSSKQFPRTNLIKVKTSKKNINIDLQLNGTNNDSDWETRTSISSKYKQVPVSDILRKLSSL